MIRVTVGNRTLGIAFQREFEIVEVEKSRGDGTLTRTKQGRPIATYCEIHTLQEVEKHIKGETRKIWDTLAMVARSRALIASRGVRDVFTYEKGRKIALTRALKQYGLSREARSLVWAAYHDRPRPISKPKLPQVKIIPEVEEGITHVDGFKAMAPDLHRNLHSLDLLAGEA